MIWKQKTMKNSLAPSDFHRFGHRTKLFKNPFQSASWTMPLWIVGTSPFDPVISSEEGYVVHLGEPRFMARWAMGGPLDQKRYGKTELYDEDLGMSLYEVSHLDQPSSDIQNWLVEAICAVAYSRGLISEMEPPEAN
jgi:hypothetical protein